MVAGESFRETRPGRLDSRFSRAEVAGQIFLKSSRRMWACACRLWSVVRDDSRQGCSLQVGGTELQGVEDRGQ